MSAFEWIFDQLPNSTTRPRSTTNGASNPPDLFHTYRQVAVANQDIDDDDSSNTNLAGLPLLFTFPGMAAGRQDYHFDAFSMVIGEQDESLFRLPEGCEDNSCGGRQSTISSGLLPTKAS